MKLTRPAASNRSTSRRPGLSLLEVLLSLAILVMAMTAIGALIDTGTDSSQDARNYNTAARLAQMKLAEVEAGITAFDSTSGDFSDTSPGDPGWQWSLSTVQGSVPNLNQVTVTVTRDINGRTFSFSIGQWIIDPTVKGSADAATRPTSSGSSTSSTGGSP